MNDTCQIQVSHAIKAMFVVVNMGYAWQTGSFKSYILFLGN